MLCWDTLYWMLGYTVLDGSGRKKKYKYHIISSNAALPFHRFCSDINLMRLFTSSPFHFIYPRFCSDIYLTRLFTSSPFHYIYPRFCSDINLMRLLTSSTNRPHSGFLCSISFCKMLISFSICETANKI